MAQAWLRLADYAAMFGDTAAVIGSADRDRFQDH